jgi:hypothetical protein
MPGWLRMLGIVVVIRKLRIDRAQVADPAVARAAGPFAIADESDT